MALVGCSTVGPGAVASAESSDASAAETMPATTETAEPADETAEASAVEVAERRVQEQLEKLAASSPRPNESQMLKAMTDAGFVEAEIEVSADITPTGLAVDAIEAAAPVDEQCIIGQVREGEVAMSVLPVLPGGNCFVGKGS
jgi:hypothetical protein